VIVKINSYSNPHNLCYRCTNDTCTDGDGGCNDVFRFCLRNSGWEGEYCPKDRTTTSSVHFDGAPLNFTAATFLNVSNPFPLQRGGKLKVRSHKIYPF